MCQGGTVQVLIKGRRGESLAQGKSLHSHVEVSHAREDGYTHGITHSPPALHR